MVYALDRRTGALKWKQELRSTPSSPVIAQDKVLVAAGGMLYLLRLADGEPLWSYAVSDEVTSPALAGSLVIVRTDDGTVTAFRGKTVG
jgi:outer membrane protein assembly factor BamB